VVIRDAIRVPLPIIDKINIRSIGLQFRDGIVTVRRHPLPMQPSCHAGCTRLT
jgi:hypothetical protein